MSLVGKSLSSVRKLHEFDIFHGTAPLRGDNRLYRLVAFIVALFIVVISVPTFQVWFKITWLPYWTDYLIVALLVGIWAFLLSVIWRFRLIESLMDMFAKITM